MPDKAELSQLSPKNLSLHCFIFTELKRSARKFSAESLRFSSKLD